MNWQRTATHSYSNSRPSNATMLDASGSNAPACRWKAPAVDRKTVQRLRPKLTTISIK